MPLADTHCRRDDGCNEHLGNQGVLEKCRRENFGHFRGLHTENWRADGRET
ncbi:hypothetical protein GCM10010502_52410 [Kitasatospora aureofaciens]|uniref:Uncharacterized protein n=1 Tax=Kitasatospora aureofaciens TaxID=1894 RepID=A0A8H9HXS4_KITAU|nr:hypothetical protein GCM10010502_52410 [Kitasatospora aureofaciens]